MKWNEFAKIGAKLQDAFISHKYTKDVQLQDATFILDILDRIKLEDGYSFKIYVAQARGIGDVSHLMAVPDSYQYNEKDSEVPYFDLIPHIIVEESEMGIFQATLLTFATSWMPVFWHGGYDKRIFIFSDDNLQSIGKGGWATDSNFNAADFAEDERLNPVVE